MYFTQIKNFIDKDVQKNISNRKQAASLFLTNLLGRKNKIYVIEIKI